MTDRIVTLQQVLADQIVPLSRSSLYRIVKEKDSPFFKAQGRWMVVESELIGYLRNGGSKPAPKQGRADELLARVEERVHA